jgi:hypothetical protein
MSHFRGFLAITYALIWATTTFFAGSAMAQDAPSSTNTKSDQWIHVRVESKEDHGETVRVNVPIEMAAKVLPAIHDERLRDGKIRIDADKMNKDVDLRAILEAVKSSRDGEYVTVQGHENDVRVAKNNGYLYVHVTDKEGSGKETAKGAKAAGTAHETKVEVKVPMKVVDALLSAGKDELDIVAALKALSAHGDTELVTVKDDENTVRVWVDSKNVSD